MIIQCGKGPMIEGSRITVYDVLAETRAGVPVAQLAEEWHLQVCQIEEAVRYIEDNREEVERDWAAIRARHARGNPPEIEAIAAEGKKRMYALRDVLAAARAQRENGNGRTADRQ